MTDFNAGLETATCAVVGTLRQKRISEPTRTRSGRQRTSAQTDDVSSGTIAQNALNYPVMFAMMCYFTRTSLLAFSSLSGEEINISRSGG
jgi:hypothetical protein